MRKRKVSVIGAGNIGATTALRIIEANLADVVLVDIAERLAQAKAIDISHSSPLVGSDCKIVGTGDYSQTSHSDIVVMTAGIALHPGMTPQDLLQTNFQVVRNCVESWKKFCPDAITIMVTDPLDLMSYSAYKILECDKRKVVGMAGLVDCARLRFLLAQKLKVSAEDISALFIGGRGEEIIPILKYTNVKGIPVEHLLSKKEIEEIISAAANGENEIINLLQAGSAFYAPAAAICEMVESILLDKKKILPCSVFLDGEFGQKNVFLGVPVKLGSSGVEEIIEIPLEYQERKALEKAARRFNELKNILNGVY